MDGFTSEEIDLDDEIVMRIFRANFLRRIAKMTDEELLRSANLACLHDQPERPRNLAYGGRRVPRRVATAPFWPEQHLHCLRFGV